MGALADDSTATYVSWKEEAVRNAKGRREVRYYLKRSDGQADLVVVGKEKTARHMFYYFPIKDNKTLLSNLRRFTILKLRSRREVIDWLNSILTGERTNSSFSQFGGDMEGKLDFDNAKDLAKQSLGSHRSEFMWMGSPLAVRKRRRHYQSFCRTGVVISVQNFVYVLAEENKRLVAYLDDMYEDSRGNKMVVVRWFHRIDEVGFVLPRNYNDREIFFSLCLQDLSVECIDGQATVLSPEHYEKFKDEATQLCLTPFVCCRQFDNDDVKPFDITRMKGYWKQKMLREMHSSSSVHKTFDEDLKVKLSLDDAVGCRPNKRIRKSNESEIVLNPANNKKEPVENIQVCGVVSIDYKGSKIISNLKEGCLAFLSERDKAILPTCRHYLTNGSEVEVLSQDSGIRGCWFRAIIIKKHKDMVKVQYQDIKDALDDAKNLEEWILASRIAAPDAFGVRVSGRGIVRPSPLSDKVGGSWTINLGSIVDAWWHDGWWEGIVVKNESSDKLHVYFPGEKHKQIFGLVDLRQSREWIGEGWKNIEVRPELVTKLLEQKTAFSTDKLAKVKQESCWIVKRDDVECKKDGDLMPKVLLKISYREAANDVQMRNCLEMVRDLSKDELLAELRWKSSGKRRRSRSPIHKWRYSEYSGVQTFDNFFVDPSLKYDPDNCKYSRDPCFNSAVVSSLTSLVMSQ